MSRQVILRLCLVHVCTFTLITLVSTTPLLKNGNISRSLFTVSGKDCISPDKTGCKCEMNDGSGTIDLTSVGYTNNQPRFKDYPAPDGAKYSYNPCHGFTEGKCINSAKQMDTISHFVTTTTLQKHMHTNRENIMCQYSNKHTLIDTHIHAEYQSTGGRICNVFEPEPRMMPRLHCSDVTRCTGYTLRCSLINEKCSESIYCNEFHLRKSVCMFHGKSMLSIGQADDVMFQYQEDLKSVVTAYFTHQTIVLSAQVELICDHTACEPVFDPQGVQEMGLYLFKMTSVCACPGMCTSSGAKSCKSNSGFFQAGNMICICFAVMVFCYLVLGVIYNKVRHKASGSNLIPHKELWITILISIKDGFKFTFGCCSSKGPRFTLTTN